MRGAAGTCSVNDWLSVHGSQWRAKLDCEIMDVVAEKNSLIRVIISVER